MITITLPDTPENRKMLVDVSITAEYDLAPHADSEAETKALDDLADAIRNALRPPAVPAPACTCARDGSCDIHGERER